MVNSQRSRRAFTLLEMAVAIMLIGMISLIGFRSTTKSTTRSLASTAKLTLFRVLTAEQVYAASRGSFTASPDELSGIGRDLTVVSSASTSPQVVSLALSSGGTLALTVLASGGECFTLVSTPLEIGGEVSEGTYSGTCSAAVLLPDDEARVLPS